MQRWCDIDLAAFFGPGGADKLRDGWYPLLDPSNSAKEVLLLFPSASLLPCIALHSLDRLSGTLGRGRAVRSHGKGVQIAAGGGGGGGGGWQVAGQGGG